MRRSIGSIAIIRHLMASHPIWLAQWNSSWCAYNFIGGHKHDDESFRECLVREIVEELNIEEGKDFQVATLPLGHLEYTDVSRRNGEATEYVIELFSVELNGPQVHSAVDANSANRWLSEAEILAETSNDGRPISPTPKRFLDHLKQKF